jgi:sulfur-oxidizing protein SoxZ
MAEVVMNQYPIRLRATRNEHWTEVKALLSHPMENGFGKGSSGELIPAHFITEVQVHLNGDLVTQIRTGTGVATNPLFGWRIKGAQVGDKVSVSWRDNLGNQQSKDTLVISPTH